jgi:5-methylcytosine-specific restriction endonuclease McrA
MLYVSMTRGRHNNEAFLYQRLAHEADHEHAERVVAPTIHQTRRGNKYSAAHYFRQILGNDERPRTMYTEVERTERALLAEVVAEVIQRNEARRRARCPPQFCAKCGRGGPDVRLVQDHIVGLAAGGLDVVANLQWLCDNPCHAVKIKREQAAGPPRILGARMY